MIDAFNDRSNHYAGVMSSLIIAVYDSCEKASKAHREVLDTFSKGTAAPEDTVVVAIDEHQEVRVQKTTKLTPPLTPGGGFVGALASLIVLHPVLALVGGISGQSVGAIQSALNDAGVHDDLTVTALVLADGMKRVGIVALDILTINEFIVDRIRARSAVDVQRVAGVVEVDRT